MKKYSLLYLILLVFNISVSQEIRGVVLDGITNLPLESVSVYFDQTTIGTTTNQKGEFTLNNTNIKTPLIISYLGYNTKSINKFSTVEIQEFYLFESNNRLDEIIINTNDNWSRDLKLKEFKRHYLGESKRGKSCRILNEDDLIIKFNKKTRKLIATSKAPIIIKNNVLNYTINVNLDYFEAKYSFVSKNKKRLNIEKVSYFGSSLYKSYPSPLLKNILEERNSAYRGSVLHFMRALSKNKLNERGYKVYLANGISDPSKIIFLSQLKNGKGVFVKLKGDLNIIYKNGNQSRIEILENEFYIDSFGNHLPPLSIQFYGDLGGQRVGDSVPLDFTSKKE
jgi:hypothetical protein